MHDITLGNLLGLIGLILDIIGAWFLAKSFVIKNIEQMENETTTYVGGNAFLLESMQEQRIEARFGFRFLFSGFLFQIINYFTNHFLLLQHKITLQNDCFYFCILSLFLLSLFVFILSSYFCKYLAKKEIYKRLKSGYHALNSEDKIRNAIFYRIHLGLSEIPNETNDKTIERIESFLERK
jgi:hypothetical protein